MYVIAFVADTFTRISLCLLSSEKMREGNGINASPSGGLLVVQQQCVFEIAFSFHSLLL